MNSSAANLKGLLPDPTPRSLGYHMPAEWHPHEGTWFSWPHNPDTWIHHLAYAEQALAEAVYWLNRGERVHINVLNASHEAHVVALLENVGAVDNIQFHHIPTNDSWCRDHGAIFLIHPEKPGLASVDWGYNAWGEKYPPYDLDQMVAWRMGEAMQARTFQTPIILEGGSIEVNGAGCLMTTEACLLNPNRNPDLQKNDIEFVLREMLGVEDILWLGGELVGDDTDSHIDNLARFVSENRIVIPVESNPDDANFEALRANEALLERLNEERGGRFDIIKLPMPAPFLVDGHRLPANYANFYIGNEVVLMPAFNDTNDDLAQAILQDCFDDRQIVPIDCTAIIWGLGALHCLSQQVPEIDRV